MYLEWDSNPHARNGHQSLNLTCLPIPPSRLYNPAYSRDSGAWTHMWPITLSTAYKAEGICPYKVVKQYFYTEDFSSYSYFVASYGIYSIDIPHRIYSADFTDSWIIRYDA